MDIARRLLPLWGLLAGHCCALRTTADVPANKRWHYVDQFVFDTTPRDALGGWYIREGPPYVRYYAHQTAADPVQADHYAVVMYDDEEFSWPAAYALAHDDDVWEQNASATCNQLAQACDYCYGCMMKFCDGPDTLGGQCRAAEPGIGGCRRESSTAPTHLNSSGSCPNGTELCATAEHPTFTFPRQSTRYRFWYLAVVNCGLRHAHGVTLELEWRNPGSWWRSHFSMDRQGLLEMYSLYVPLGVVLFAAYAVRLWMAQREQGDGAYMHFVLKWWFGTALCQIMCFVFLWGHYLSFASDGRGHPGVMWTAVGLRTLAALLFVVLLLAFSTGFTVIGVSLSTPLLAPLQKQRKIIVGVFFTLMVLNIIAYCLTAASMNQMPESVPHNNPYQTWAGIFLACLRVPIAAYYVYNLNGTVRAAPEMLRFYQIWGGGFLIYIGFLPVAMLLAHVVSPWVMFRAVECTVDTVTFVAFVAMGALLWPGNRAQSALARTYSIADTGPTHMPIGDFGSALPSGPNRGGSFTSDSAAAQAIRGHGGDGLLVEDDDDGPTQSIQMRNLQAD